MKLRFSDELGHKAVVPAVFAATGLLCFLLSLWAVSGIERFSRLGVHKALAEAGHSWAEVDANGLQVILSGTAPTEAMRFRALAIAGNVVDASRLRDHMSVADGASLAAPDFSIEILRNDDGISLIGLVPLSTDRAALLDSFKAIDAQKQVTDMLESTDHPAPQGWEPAVGFGLSAIKMLLRAKVTIRPGAVAITAIGDSAKQKSQIEADLRRKAPTGLSLKLDITAPHPVIAPFTLRFLIDANGARFDACSADTDRARDQILAAGIAAGAPKGSACIVGLGVPTPDWAKAVTLSLAAMKTIGNGSITFKDTEIALNAESDVTQSAFDDAVGELESNLPPVFSLHATLTPKGAGDVAAGPAEFIGTLSQDGMVDLRGRLPDDLSRKAVDSFAQSRFGTKSVHAAIRKDTTLPEGWSARVLVGLTALAEMDQGKVTVLPDRIRLEGKTGSTDTSDVVSRILSSQLGAGGRYDLAISYVKELDPTANLPTGTECVGQINATLADQKIAFEPGSAVIDPSSNATLDKIAEIMKNCSDFPMEVGGHTDSQGREEMNLALSEQRARAVIVALQTRRILTGNLQAKGYGENEAIADNDTEAGRERNRRIEFKLVNPTTGADASADGEGASAVPDAIPVHTPDDKTIRPRPRPKTLKTK